MDKVICKHLVAACLKTNTNLPGLDFMPRVFVSRWKRKRREFSSSANRVVLNEYIEHNEDIASSIPSLEVQRVEELVTTKARVGRPPKIGHAIETDNMIKKLKKPVKRLVKFQPRVSERLRNSQKN